MTFSGIDQARRWLAAIYRRDRTANMDTSVYLGVEKAGIVEQLRSWFDDLGVPILALKGYASESYVREVAEDVAAQDRPAVLLYAGDFDPSGEDIVRDFVDRANCFNKLVRIALTAGQVVEYDLPPQPGKTTDSRAPGFVARHGRLVQVEFDALPPNTLRTLYAEALADFWDVSAFEQVLARETSEREALQP